MTIADEDDDEQGFKPLLHVLISAAALLVPLGVHGFILPRFIRIFEELGVALPAPTRILFSDAGLIGMLILVLTPTICAILLRRNLIGLLLLIILAMIAFTVIGLFMPLIGVISSL